MSAKMVADFVNRYGMSVTVKRRIDGSESSFDTYSTKARIITVTTSRNEREVAVGIGQEQSAAIFGALDIPASFGALAGGNGWPDKGDLIVAESGTFEITGSNPSFIGDQLYRIDCNLEI